MTDFTFRVEIFRNETSQPIVYDAINTYTKGQLFCVLFEDEDGFLVVNKYPLCSIFKIVENYK
jgi:hypothetical protein